MGRTLEDKQAMVAELKQILSESQLALVIDYRGLSVAEISDLRKRLRPTGTVCKVTKNTLMGVAIEGDQNWQPLTQFLNGSNAFLLVKDDLGGAVKAYQDFQKAAKKTELRGGVMQGTALDEAGVKAVVDLPSKEELIARIARALNANTTKLAVGINAVPTKLAVGVKEVPGKLVRAIKAVSEQEQQSA
ncbi:MAG: 50S ribosomal protein L10 [Leptolyngbyaceae cyanobacterium RU_5_1]|nr:50S ribosomal protein L10 [Leptolyngbyaceae cyanobacterium RU_5_1]